jgi:hypothetical protein
MGARISVYSRSSRAVSSAASAASRAAFASLKRAWRASASSVEIAFGRELLGASCFPLGVFAPHLGLLVFSVAAVEFSLVPATIDHEQDIAFLHELTGTEAHLLDVSRDARAHLDILDCFGAASEFVPFDEFLLFYRCHRNDRRWRRGRCVDLLAAGPNRRGNGQGGQEQDILEK